MGKQWFRGAVVPLIVLLVVGGCTSTAPSSTAESAKPIDPRQTVLTIAVAAEVQTFDPHVNVAAISGYRFYPNIYETLIQYAPDGSLQPMLADSWTASADALTYSFKLKPNVLFSDGTAFNAEAVKFGFDRLRAVGKGAVALFEPVESVRVVDQLNVELRLKRPYAPFLQLLAAWQGALFVSPAAVQKNEQGSDRAEGWLRNHTAGTGPFMLESWEPNSKVVAIRNPSFREPPTADAVQRVVVQLVTEPSTARQLLTGGGVDIIEEATPALIQPLQQASGITVGFDPRVSDSVAIAFNNARPPFDKQEFRRAIAYSIDYKRLLQIWQGIAVQSPGLYAESFTPWFSKESVTTFGLDLAKAEESFRRSGQQFPLNPRLKATALFQAGQTPQRDMGVLIKEDLAKVGIDLEIVSAELPVWRQAIWTNNFDMAFIGLGLRFPDPDALASLVLPSREFRNMGFNPGIRNTQLDQLIERGKATTGDARRQIYSEIQKIVSEQAYFLWLVEKKHAWARGNDVTRMVWNPNYGPFFRWDQIRKTGAR